MGVTEDLIRFAQNQLNSKYVTNIDVDGILGSSTTRAILSLKFPKIDKKWSNSRVLVGFIQQLCTLYDIPVGDIDGFYGPQTDYAIELLKYKIQMGKLPPDWRTDEGEGVIITPTRRSNKPKWPVQTQQALTNFYGKVGTNQTTIVTPYPMRIAWNLKSKTNKITCHEKVAESLLVVLNNVKSAYGKDISRLNLDVFGGCLNVRPMRGGSKMSTHSWGIALDFDPVNNQLKWKKDRATFAKPEYNTWWDIWEAEGWVSLGRKRDYDWMHVQAAIF
jgi:peptidoglycan hydrolase-like protein with peptidoglycan-binding domain